MLLGLCPYSAQVLATFARPIEAVRLMWLASGAAIKFHCDHDLAAEQGVARLHTVANAGTTTPVHLVSDAIVDPWLEDLLDRSKTVA